MEILTTVGLVVILVMVLRLKKKTREEYARLLERRNAEINLRVRIARENAAIRAALSEAGLELEEIVEPKMECGCPSFMENGPGIYFGIKVASSNPKFKVVKSKKTKPHA